MKSLNQAHLEQRLALASATAIWLDEDEPAAFEVVNAQGQSPLVLIADHASNRVPRCLHQLGLDDETLASHIGWDAGTANVARQLSAWLDAPLVMSNYSRLVIDCNRAPSSAHAILEASDRIAIPGNAQLSAPHIASRRALLFDPYHLAIARLLESRQYESTALVSIHSFNPTLNGTARPWTMGVCYAHDRRLAHAMLPALIHSVPGPIGDNEPYSIEDDIDYSLPLHAASKGLPHVMLEIRRDKIDTEENALHFATLLRSACAAIAASLTTLPERPFEA